METRGHEAMGGGEKNRNVRIYKAFYVQTVTLEIFLNCKTKPNVIQWSLYLRLLNIVHFISIITHEQPCMNSSMMLLLNQRKAVEFLPLLAHTDVIS